MRRRRIVMRTYPLPSRSSTTRSNRSRPVGSWVTTISVRSVASTSSMQRVGQGRVEHRRRLVEDEDLGGADERAGEPDALALAARDGDAVLADDGVDAVGESLEPGA